MGLGWYGMVHSTHGIVFARGKGLYTLLHYTHSIVISLSLALFFWNQKKKVVLGERNERELGSVLSLYFCPGSLSRCFSGFSGTVFPLPFLSFFFFVLLLPIRVFFSSGVCMLPFSKGSTTVLCILRLLLRDYELPVCTADFRWYSLQSFVKLTHSHWFTLFFSFIICSLNSIFYSLFSLLSLSLPSIDSNCIDGYTERVHLSPKPKDF